MPDRTARVEITYTFELDFRLGMAGYPEDISAQEAAERLLAAPSLHGGYDLGVMPSDADSSLEAVWTDDGDEAGA